MNNGQPIGGFLHLGKHTKKTEIFSFCSFKFQMTAEIVSLNKQELTSVAIIHSSFSSDITNTDLYLVSAHADISGAFFSDASL